MSESDEENTATRAFPAKSKEAVNVREVLMDFDLDLDNPWPMDPIAFISNNPMSPLVFSSGDLPCSPLWAFCDADNEEKLARHVNSAIADSSRLLSSCEFSPLIRFSSMEIPLILKLLISLILKLLIRFRCVWIELPRFCHRMGNL